MPGSVQTPIGEIGGMERDKGGGSQMNKLYFFSDDEERGVFVGADTWRKARNFAFGHENMDGIEFIDIRGHLCRESGKPVYTTVAGEHDADDLMAAGYTNFWWMGDCAICGSWSERLTPINGKLICSDCEDPEEVATK